MADLRDLQKLLDNVSFVRWVIGNGNSEESHYWEDWISRSPDNRALAKEARVLIEGIRAGEPVPPDRFHELRRFKHAAKHLAKNRNEEWNFSKYQRRAAPLYIAIAAGIVLLIGILFLFTPLQQKKETSISSGKLANVQEFQTGYGQKSILRLSDGSRIVLNAHSKLSFSSSAQHAGEVDVWLKGEAYFSISHLTGNSKRIFRVHTKDGTIIDLGTQFSVNTNSEETKVALVEGKVSIRVKKGNSSSKDDPYVMQPGQLALFQQGDNHIEVRRVDPEVYTSWTTDKLIYDHTPLSQVVQRIENTYGVQVVVNKNLQDSRLSGSLRNNNLDVLEKALSKALRVPVHQQQGPEGEVIYIGR